METVDRYLSIFVTDSSVKQVYHNFKNMFKTIKGVGALNASNDLPKCLRIRIKSIYVPSGQKSTSILKIFRRRIFYDFWPVLIKE